MHCHCVCVEYVQCVYTPKVGTENKGEGRTGERLVRACTLSCECGFSGVLHVSALVWYVRTVCWSYACGGAHVQFHGVVLVWLM